MVQPKIQFNLGNAKQYFREHLCVGDYYSQGAKVDGEWLGEGAQRLGLEGAVKEEAFLALCEGKDPRTGDKLGQRMNTVRQDAGKDNVANRRIFFDFTIAPPKSVSVVALYQDDRIIGLHNKAVRQTMLELEKFAETRVRKGGENSERVTGNIVTACFRHDTSRELDPHLHTHCVVFNATFDPVEDRWKGLQPAGMYRAQNFATNFYRHELSKGLRALGYEIENTPRGFEIKGIPRSVIARFSKRNQQINEETGQQLKIGSPGVDIGELRKRIAYGNRPRKLRNATAEQLRSSWRKQLAPEEIKALAALRDLRPMTVKAVEVAAIVAWADEHLFERRSIVHEHELWSEALSRGRGEDFGLGALRQAIGDRGYVRERGTGRLTSREVLGWELEVVVAAHDGRNEHPKLAPDFRPSDKLSAEQKVAVEKILQSRHLITVFSGGAGTGKSRTLQEVERGLTSVNRPTVILAPQRQQVSDLQADGLPARTLSRFLMEKQVPRGAVVFLDEAGQVGGRDLAQLVRVVRESRGRLILSGDTRQHGAVAASDALCAIEKHSGIKPIRLRQIRRQDPKLGATARERRFIARYRSAVKAAAKGNTGESYDRLESLGCIRECTAEERRSLLASEYTAAIGRKERVLVVAQTRQEAHEVNEEVRKQLGAAGALGPSEKLTTFRPLDFGEAQKRDQRFYSEGQHVYFLQRYGRYKRGDVCAVVGTTDRGVVMEKDGRRSTLAYRYADRLLVVERAEMEIARGDRLQLRANGQSADGKGFANGELVTVRHVKRDGALVVVGDDGVTKRLSPSQRLFTRGYAVTSNGSQGKTVDTVLFSDAASRPATSAKQWYVTISRGRKRVLVFTSDKTQLRERIAQAGERELALDLKPEAARRSVTLLEARRMAMDAAERYRRHQAVVARGQKPSLRQRAVA